jgi:hypothetical protein
MVRKRSFGYTLRRLSPGIFSTSLLSEMPNNDMQLPRALGEVDAEFEQLAMDARGAPSRFSVAIRRIRSRSSLDVDGRPGPFWRDLRRQKRRKPRRCQRTTVSGRTITRTSVQCAQTRESHAQKILTLEPEPFGPGTA